MRMHMAVAASLLALAACQPPADAPAKPAESAAGTEQTASTGGCDVQIEKPWLENTAEASVMGPTCEQGVALLVIRHAGTPVFTWSGLTTFLFGLNEAKDPAAMRSALLDWIDQGEKPDTTSSLPPWEETEGQPRRAEFPFMPAEWLNKDGYEQLKKSDLPMFCFPQGMESSQCAVLRPGENGMPASMEEIGLQLFPG